MPTPDQAVLAALVDAQTSFFRFCEIETDTSYTALRAWAADSLISEGGPPLRAVGFPEPEAGPPHRESGSSPSTVAPSFAKAPADTQEPFGKLMGGRDPPITLL